MLFYVILDKNKTQAKQIGTKGFKYKRSVKVNGKNILRLRIILNEGFNNGRITTNILCSNYNHF